MEQPFSSRNASSVVPQALGSMRHLKLVCDGSYFSLIRCALGFYSTFFPFEKHWRLSVSLTPGDIRDILRAKSDLRNANIL